MIYMENWRMIMFLGTPVMPDLTSLISTGLYINDLSMHDFSRFDYFCWHTVIISIYILCIFRQFTFRDLMLAGTQQSVELKLALDQEQQKSKKLEESMRKLDDEMRRTDELLYQMIPKQVADRLRRGENPIDTCEIFDSVSILFSDVVTFTEICSRISPMEVVSMLNGMYSIFDTLTERNNVYKVETIGDAYMVVSGAPEKDQNHAEKVCDMALDMVEAITDLKDPSTGTHLRIRVGVHSGAVVAGIVGLKMPRYCLFGDSVNTASRMESTSTAMKVHISETTKELLGPNYKLTDRGEIEVKGKGNMKTYWLDDRENRSKLSSHILAAVAAIGSGVPAIEAPPAAAAAITTVSTVVSNASSAAKDRVVMPAMNVGKQDSPVVPTVDLKVAQHKLAMIDQVVAPTVSPDRRVSIAAIGMMGSVEDRRVYSPVTFQDVAMRSIANSPVKSLYSGRGE